MPSAASFWEHHIRFDLGTLDQAADLFLELDLRAIIISGTHRCANSAATVCTGTSTVCTGSSAAYQESDMARNTATFFQVAHEVLSDHFDHDLVLSLHGMGFDGASVSNGTHQPDVIQQSNRP